MKALFVNVVVVASARPQTHLRVECASDRQLLLVRLLCVRRAGRVAAAAGSAQASDLCAAGSDPERVARPCFVDAQKELVVETLGARAELPCAVYGARKSNVCVRLRLLTSTTRL